MNRRSFINSMAIGATSLAFFTKVAQAQTVPPVPQAIPVSITMDISNNHGHHGVISYESVIIGNQLTIDIQGDSGHPHTLILTEDDLKVLRQKLVVDVKSSVDANHAHMVRITRIPVPNLV
jgi:hypothetical protein